MSWITAEVNFLPSKTRSLTITNKHHSHLNLLVSFTSKHIEEVVFRMYMWLQFSKQFAFAGPYAIKKRKKLKFDDASKNGK